MYSVQRSYVNILLSKYVRFICFRSLFVGNLSFGLPSLPFPCPSIITKLTCNVALILLSLSLSLSFLWYCYQLSLLLPVPFNAVTVTIYRYYLPLLFTITIYRYCFELLLLYVFPFISFVWYCFSCVFPVLMISFYCAHGIRDASSPLKRF